MTFSSRFLKCAEQRSPFCLGIDPTKDLLQQWGCLPTPQGLRQFCHQVVEASHDLLAVVKPQAAYFEGFGPEGWDILRWLIRAYQERGTLVLLDVKRSDIGSSALAYGQAYLGPDSPYQADAMTVVPYFGFGALRPLLEHAVNVGAGVFVVVRSSNPEGKTLQEAQVHGISLADHVAEAITAFNTQHALGAPIGPVGAVMDATLSRSSIETTAELLNRSLFLCPGIGAQGASFSDLVTNYPRVRSRLIPTSSRAILAVGPGEADVREALRRHCEESRTLWSASA